MNNRNQNQISLNRTQTATPAPATTYLVVFTVEGYERDGKSQTR